MWLDIERFIKSYQRVNLTSFTLNSTSQYPPGFTPTCELSLSQPQPIPMFGLSLQWQLDINQNLNKSVIFYVQSRKPNLVMFLISQLDNNQHNTTHSSDQKI